MLLLVDSITAEESIINTSIIHEDFEELQQALNSLGANEKEAYKQRVTAKVNKVYRILRKQHDQARCFAF